MEQKTGLRRRKKGEEEKGTLLNGIDLSLQHSMAMAVVTS
jgi:hypothetical protein